ncbi:MAG: RNA methyltransferase, partial [Prevotella sp.]|nr:RNA methyltransferase [Prevotella sp.]
MISKNQFKFVRQLEQKKYRRREGLFVAEGTKVVGDLMQHSQPRMLFATSEYLDASPQLLQMGYEAVRITDDELRRLSFLQHPQQVLALFPLPSPSHSLTPSPSHLSIALDGVQDPGNLGTIIRLADWFGIESIYCSEDTVDAWNPKVVQATMGSIARVDIIYMNLPEMLDNLPADFPVYGTFLDGENIYQQPLSENGLIIMGNEGNGIS